MGDMSSAEWRQPVRQSVMTAFFLGLGFLAIGKSVFRLLGLAVLTTLLICLDAYGLLPTLASLVVNPVLVWAAFHHAELLLRILGENGSKAVAKVTSLLLAAIGVMMVRRGVMDLLTGPLP